MNRETNKGSSNHNLNNGYAYRLNEIKRKSDVSKLMFRLPFTVLGKNPVYSRAFYGHSFAHRIYDINPEPIKNTLFVGFTYEKYLNNYDYVKDNYQSKRSKNSSVVNSAKKIKLDADSKLKKKNQNELSRKARHLKRKMKSCNVNLKLLEFKDILEMNISQATLNFIKLNQNYITPQSRVLTEIRRKSSEEEKLTEESESTHSQHDTFNSITTQSISSTTEEKTKSIHDIIEYISLSDDTDESEDEQKRLELDINDSFSNISVSTDSSLNYSSSDLAENLNENKDYRNKNIYTFLKTNHSNLLEPRKFPPIFPENSLKSSTLDKLNLTANDRFENFIKEKKFNLLEKSKISINKSSLYKDTFKSRAYTNDFVMNKFRNNSEKPNFTPPVSIQTTKYQDFLRINQEKQLFEKNTPFKTCYNDYNDPRFEKSSKYIHIKNNKSQKLPGRYGDKNLLEDFNDNKQVEVIDLTD